MGLVGLGVMGGSLARALAALEPRPRITAWSREASDLDQALQAGAVDEVASDAAAAASGSDLVIYAVPLGAALELLGDHRAVWRPGATVTDVVSLKAPLVERMRGLGAGERFVGGHPMTGAASSGFGASRTDLYAGARVWLTRDTGSPTARKAVEDVWTSLGADANWIAAREHDRRMVWASHLPQLLANVLAGVLEDEAMEPPDLGPGGKGMTRLAGSSPEMWEDLLAASAPEAARALARLRQAVAQVERALEEGRVSDVSVLMERTRAWLGAERQPAEAGIPEPENGQRGAES